MRRKDLVRLYSNEYVDDPKRPGKLKARPRYVGPHYEIDYMRLKADRVLLWLMMAAAVAGFLCGGLTRPQVLMTQSLLNTMVLFAYILTVIPIAMLLYAIFLLSRVKESRITEIVRQDGFGRCRGAGMVLALLSVIWLIGDVVCLVFDGSKMGFWNECVFLLGSVLSGGAGSVLYGWARKFTVTDPRAEAAKAARGRKGKHHG